MKLQEEHKKYIIDAFSKMNSKEDLLNLLNFAKKLVYGEKAFHFELRQINYYGNPNANKKRYTQFTIKKKSGADRTINAPVKGLKAIQKCLNLILQVVYEKHQHKAATGFVPEKSIVDNAQLHIGSIYVYNIDLKDFFPSIDQARVWKRLQLHPFNLKDNKKEIKGKGDKIADGKDVVSNLKENSSRLKLNNMISAICCAEMEVERLNENNEWTKIKKNVLPQGAPTSPTLTNIICQQLDFYLFAVAKRFGLKYSRYADDITFSSMHNVFQKEGEFVKELHRIIVSQNFNIKESKTRLQKKGYRQEVTGLIVNEKVNVQLCYIKQLRVYLHQWEKLGYDGANLIFLNHYKKDKGHTKSGAPNMTNVIAGKLHYLKMVKGRENNMYKKLKGRFDELNSRTNPIYEILDIWENEGIEKAMEKYYTPKKEGKLKRTLEEIKEKKPNLVSVHFLDYAIEIKAKKFEVVNDTVCFYDDDNLIKTISVGKKDLENLSEESLIQEENANGKNWMVLKSGYSGKDWLYYEEIIFGSIT